MRALIGLLAVRNPPVNAHEHYRFLPLRFLFTKPSELSDLALKKTSLKKEEIEQNTHLFFNYEF